uniref:Uncharacterized protein n=1 Tax=Rhabditophanes sp. KR3021 TaxID=114890 RepID=A0AC35TJI9_9BILA
MTETKKDQTTDKCESNKGKPNFTQWRSKKMAFGDRFKKRALEYDDNDGNDLEPLQKLTPNQINLVDKLVTKLIQLNLELIETREAFHLVKTVDVIESVVVAGRRVKDLSQNEEEQVKIENVKNQRKILNAVRRKTVSLRNATYFTPNRVSILASLSKTPFKTPNIGSKFRIGNARTPSCSRTQKRAGINLFTPTLNAISKTVKMTPCEVSVEMMTMSRNSGNSFVRHSNSRLSKVKVLKDKKPMKPRDLFGAKQAKGNAEISLTGDDVLDLTKTTPPQSQSNYGTNVLQQSKSLMHFGSIELSNNPFIDELNLSNSNAPCRNNDKPPSRANERNKTTNRIRRCLTEYESD